MATSKQTPALSKENTLDAPIPTSTAPGLHYDQEIQVFRRYVPPHDLHSVHEEIVDHAAEIESRMHLFDRDFYGNANDRLFVKRLAALIKPVQDVTDVMTLSSRKDMENMLMSMKDKITETKLDESVARLEAYNKKMCFYVPKCLKLMQEVYALARETEKYCQSFYDSETMVELGTAKDYEDLRKSIYQAINENLKKLKSMWHRYDNGTGLELPQFRPEVGGFALECECTRQLCLLMFPEARDTILEAAEKLREWVRTDKSFVTYLEGDRVYFHENLHYIDNELRAAKSKFHNIVGNVDVVNEQLDEGMRNFGSGNAKEMLAELNSEDQVLRSKLRELQTLLHSYNLDKLALKRRIRERPDVSDTRENRDRVEQLSGMIVSLEQEIRQLRNEIKRISQKLVVASQYYDRKTILEAKRDRAVRVKVELDLQITSLKEKQNKMTQQAELADAIIRLKTAPNAAYNIYYNLAKKPAEQDPVVLACGVVSKHIRRKWPLLYRSLPHQGRGELEVDDDIKEITNRSRVTTANRASRALNKWRRFNSKASISDIKKALNHIEEPKLWTRVQRVAKLDENLYEEEEEEDLLKHVPVELRPYYIIIERFDEMNRRLAEEQARQKQKEELLKKYSTNADQTAASATF